MPKTIRISLLVFLAASRFGLCETLRPASIQRLDTAASGVAWLDANRLVVATSAGVRALSLKDGTWTDLILPRALPDGLPDPLSVVTDGTSVVASNGFERSVFACRADNGNRIFARSGASPMVIDIAVSGKQFYFLGWHVDAHGANNADGVAVWRGNLNAKFNTFQPLHRIQSGPEAVGIFNDSLPVYGGALAVEADGTLDVVTAAEAGIFQYAKDGSLRRRLGTGLGDLVLRRMHDINFTYGADPMARYREVMNRQPTVDDLVATPDGPALVVRIARSDNIEWELWYVNEKRTDRRVKLGISRLGPYGHLSCDARDRNLACVYQSPSSAKEALEMNPAKLQTFLVRFKLPPAHEEHKLVVGK